MFNEFYDFSSQVCGKFSRQLRLPARALRHRVSLHVAGRDRGRLRRRRDAGDQEPEPHTQGRADSARGRFLRISETVRSENRSEQRPIGRKAARKVEREVQVEVRRGHRRSQGFAQTSGNRKRGSRRVFQLEEVDFGRKDFRSERETSEFCSTHSAQRQADRGRQQEGVRAREKAEPSRGRPAEKGPGSPEAADEPKLASDVEA